MQHYRLRAFGGRPGPGRLDMKDSTFLISARSHTLIVRAPSVIRGGATTLPERIQACKLCLEIPTRSAA